nr:MAG TPA: hypothetical protein [Caudoviricetes sp.]
MRGADSRERPAIYAKVLQMGDRASPNLAVETHAVSNTVLGTR